MHYHVGGQLELKPTGDSGKSCIIYPRVIPTMGRSRSYPANLHLSLMVASDGINSLTILACPSYEPR